MFAKKRLRSKSHDGDDVVAQWFASSEIPGRVWAVPVWSLHVLALFRASPSIRTLVAWEKTGNMLCSKKRPKAGRENMSDRRSVSGSF